jgi:hypothetical protein
MTWLSTHNLHAVRGPIDPISRDVVFAASMSGPHAYLGYLDPVDRSFIVEPDGKGLMNYREIKNRKTI